MILFLCQWHCIDVPWWIKIVFEIEIEKSIHTPADHESGVSISILYVIDLQYKYMRPGPGQMLVGPQK